MSGIKSLVSYEDVEIHGPGHEKRAISLPCIIPKGQDLVKGQVVGYEPGSHEVVKAYDHDGAAASASTPAAGSSNTGGGSCSAIDVQDAYTNTESWVLTCTKAATGGGEFSVVGNRSGNIGTATVGAEFKYPNTSAYELKFTVSDGSPDFAVGDTWTFTTTGKAAVDASGILPEDVDATDEDQFSCIEVGGVFEIAKLTGLDDDAKMSMAARQAGAYLIL
jgi:predicted  nucleic acid-binding Zn-ribbon protein